MATSQSMSTCKFLATALVTFFGTNACEVDINEVGLTTTVGGASTVATGSGAGSSAANTAGSVAAHTGGMVSAETGGAAGGWSTGGANGGQGGLSSGGTDASGGFAGSVNSAGGHPSGGALATSGGAIAASGGALATSGGATAASGGVGTHAGGTSASGGHSSTAGITGGSTVIAGTGGRTARSCIRPDDCGESEYCLFNPCAIETGRCTTRPSECPETDASQPVCACSGVTQYDSSCAAEKLGVSYQPGLCAGSVCSKNADCSADTFCDVPGCGATSGTCQRVPVASDCTGAAPVCGCDGTTYSSACMANLRSVSVLHDGPC